MRMEAQKLQLWENVTAAPTFPEYQECLEFDQMEVVSASEHPRMKIVASFSYD